MSQGNTPILLPTTGTPMSLSNHELSKPRIFVLHENTPWVEPLRRELAAIEAPFSEWFLDRGQVDLTSSPPEGIFYNRMSASSHTRGHRFAPEYTGAVLAWLTRHGRTIVNGERALQLEVSKVAQYESLAKFGIETPATIAVIGREHIPRAASAIGYPIILKHNRAGKGLGVKLIYSDAALEEHLASEAFEGSVDGILLVQRYIKAPKPFITRVEFVGGQLLYAVHVDTSQGFELCPADACNVAQASEACPAVAQSDKFQIVRHFEHPLIPTWQSFLTANDIGVAGIEFIEDARGRAYTYDVNTNTNYNPDAEAKDGRRGMQAIALHLGRLLVKQYDPTSRLASAA
jgi:glutathione synthase/RimK-type ligase-like ATP-grasp enzyme